MTNEEVKRSYHTTSIQLSYRKETTSSVRASCESQLTHHKTTRVSFEQPSIVLQRIGDAGQVDQGGHVLFCETYMLFDLI